MSLVHGREITGEQVELIIGREFSVQRFVSMCNAMLWALSRPAGLTQVSLTERVFVADNGVDAELVIDVPPYAPPPGSLLIPGDSVVQYKQRDLTARDRNRIVGDLRGNLRGAAREVSERTGRPRNQYLLFTNVSLSIDEKHDIEEAIKEGSPDVRVQVFGAAEIAAMLNNLPHLRSAYFSTARFASWQRFWDGHNRQALSGTVPVLVGRKDVLSATKAAVDDESIRVVLISGGPDIGKTRLALDVTQHRPFDTVVAIEGRTLTVADLLALRSRGQPLVIVVDDPDESTADALISAALAEELKLVMTVPSSDAANVVNYGRDPRVKVLTLDPLTDEESRELLLAAGARMEYSVESWVIEQSGGNPGVLIAAASVGGQLRLEGANFFDQVGGALESRARAILGQDALNYLRLVSVMTAVGFSGQAATELRILCDTFGAIRPNDILARTRMMARSGLLRITGSYLEVVPPVLANYLAETALAGRAGDIPALFLALPPLGRARLLKRLRQLRSEAVQGFWDELFRTGPLAAFRTALAEVPLLRLVAPAVPGRVANLLFAGLTEMSLDERLAIEGHVRRDLVWTIEQLLFRTQSALPALRCLALLAEAENEQWSNNSSGVFAECFHPSHPQLPLPLTDRVTVLRGLVARDASKAQKLLAIKAVDEAFKRTGTVTLRRSEGPEPFDAVPVMTYGQIREYLRSLVDLIRPLMQDPDPEAARKAGQIAMTSIGEYTVQADPDAGVQLLEVLGPEVLRGGVPIEIETYVATLRRVSRAIPAEAQFERATARVRQLLEMLDEAGFQVNLKRWVGSWDFGEEAHDEDGRRVFRGELEIRRLAEIAAADRTVVSDDLLQWLTSPEAKRGYELFYWLGKFDREQLWRETIERLGEQESGEQAFASYFGGRGSEAPAEIAQRLDELAARHQVRGSAIVGATGFLPANRVAVDRVVSLVDGGFVDPDRAERRLIGGGWMRPLTADEAVTLLRAIAGPDLQRAGLVIDFLAMWVHCQKPIEGSLAEFAWQALEATPEHGEAWDFDLVAASLVPIDRDRAFNLLRCYVTLPHDRRSWEPLDRHGGNGFWNALWALDPGRCVETLLDAGAESPLVAWRINWHLPEVLDLVRDRDLLLRVARRNERSAEFVSSCLAAKDGFWPIAVELLARYPDNRLIRRNVSAAAEHVNRVVVGPSSQHHERCAQEVEAVIADAATPAVVKPFLTDLARQLRQRAQAERRNEEDERINW
jgi:hypothetical protein